MHTRAFVAFTLASALGACSLTPKAPAGGSPRISLPAFTGWYDNTRVFYITTDISDAEMGRSTGANYAPRLRDAVPSYPKTPGELTVLERVYKFPAGKQDAVFASAPHPIGPSSQDVAYSPLWLLYTVKWLSPTGKEPLLTSELAILDAEEHGLVTVERTDIVINCPIVASTSAGQLPGATLSR